MITRERKIDKILDRYNLLCINKKEETYYKAFDSSKSTINLTVANPMIALELEWSKEYELRGSDHFTIIIEEEREVSMEHRKCKFQKESTITTKVQNQNTIEKAHSCLVKTYYKQQRNLTPKHPRRQKEDQQ